MYVNAVVVQAGTFSHPLHLHNIDHYRKVSWMGNLKKYCKGGGRGGLDWFQYNLSSWLTADFFNCCCKTDAYIFSCRENQYLFMLQDGIKGE